MSGKNFSFLNNITDDDKVLLSKVLDRAEMAQEKYVQRFTAFLDERQCALCEQVLKSNKYENYLFWGGYESASRMMLGFFPPYDEISRDVFPMKSLLFTYREQDKLTHRDFLGAIMSLQIKRECVGDILVQDGKTAVMLTEKVSDDVLYSVKKIGRVGVKVNYGFDENMIARTEFMEISGTVASLRIDAVLSLALKISREKATALIKNTGVEINHLIVYRPDAAVNEKDIFSVRGYGKFKFDSLEGVSKKDRIHIKLCKYI